MASMHVRFSTGTVAPVSVPTFPYIASAISYEHVTYTALIEASEVSDVSAQIIALWSGASITSITVNHGEFTENDKAIKGHIFGVVRNATPDTRGFFAKLWGHAVSEKSFREQARLDTTATERYA